MSEPKTYADALEEVNKTWKEFLQEIITGFKIDKMIVWLVSKLFNLKKEAK